LKAKIYLANEFAFLQNQENFVAKNEELYTKMKALELMREVEKK